MRPQPQRTQGGRGNVASDPVSTDDAVRVSQYILTGQPLLRHSRATWSVGNWLCHLSVRLVSRHLHGRCLTPPLASVGRSTRPRRYRTSLTSRGRSNRR